jgi:TolB-like protein/Tfp pilus assembly protein PilF
MSTEVFKRKLTAILSADVKGYSRLMREDEEATIRTLTSYRTAMADLIEQFRGRVVDSPGDNLLAEFTSVVDAVNCAVEIQRELAERNAELPEDRRMQFRIGVNLGDVIEEGERIYGDGVNIAARMEGLAEAGGICISGTVYDQVKHKLGLEYEDLGQQEVKNIAEPVPAYRVLSFPGAAAHRVVKAKKAVERRWRNTVLAIAAILVVGAAAWVIWNYYLRPAPVEVASVDKMAYPLPDKPSIAVLPFVNMSGDPKQEYFSDGITEEIITALSKLPKLFVIARNSTFTYKGKPVKVQQVSQDLGVRYVLEGSVRKAGDKVRITAQLIDALTGRHLWAERYDRRLKDIFAVQDEITMKIITAMGVKLTAGEQARLSAKGTDNLDAYLKYLEGREHLFRFNKDNNLLARQRAEEAMDLDPEYSNAHALLGKTHILDVWFKWSKSPKESLVRAFEFAKKALALDESNIVARRALSHIYLLKRQHDKAIAECERTVSYAPNAADSIYNLGIILRFSGRAKEAISMHERAIRLNPMPPASYLYQLGLCYTFIGEFEKAIAICNKALDQNPNDLVGRITLAIAYSSLGREEEARAEAAEVLRINPKFSVEYASKTWPYKNQADRDLVFGALRKAGLK